MQESAYRRIIQDAPKGAVKRATIQQTPKQEQGPPAMRQLLTFEV